MGVGEPGDQEDGGDREGGGWRRPGCATCSRDCFMPSGSVARHESPGEPGGQRPAPTPCRPIGSLPSASRRLAVNSGRAPPRPRGDHRRTPSPPAASPARSGAAGTGSAAAAGSAPSRAEDTCARSLEQVCGADRRPRPPRTGRRPVARPGPRRPAPAAPRDLRWQGPERGPDALRHRVSGHWGHRWPAAAAPGAP